MNNSKTGDPSPACMASFSFFRIRYIYPFINHYSITTTFTRVLDRRHRDDLNECLEFIYDSSHGISFLIGQHRSSDFTTWSLTPHFKGLYCIYLNLFPPTLRIFCASITLDTRTS